MKPSSRIKTIITVAILFAMTISSVAMSATTSDPILNMIPADSIFCLRVNNLDQALSSLDQFMTGASPMPVGMMAEMALGGIMGDPMLANVNTQGSMAVFGTMADGELAVGIIMPIESFQKFTSSNANASAPDAMGISTIKGQLSFPMPMEMQTYATALPKKGYMLLSMDPETLSVAKKAVTSTAIATKLDNSDVSAATAKPMWARINIAKINELFGPMLAAQLDKAKQEITTQMEQAPEGQKPPMDPAKIMGIYFDVFQKLLDESDYINISLDPTADVLYINETYGAKKGSDIAGLLVDSDTPKGAFKTAKYLNSPEAVNVLIKVDKKISAVTNAKMLELISAITEDLPQQQIVRWKTLMVDSIEAMGDEQAFSFSMGKGSPPFSMKQAIMLDDPAAYDAVMKESFSIVNDFYKALGLPVTIDIADAATQTYKGVTVSTVDINIDAEKMVPGEPQAVDMINKMYENMAFKSAIANKNFVMAMGPNADADIKKLIDQTSSSTSAPTGDVATAMKLLKNSDNADFLVTVNYLRLLGGIGEMFKEMSVPESEQIAKMFSAFNIDSKSCLAMAGNVGDGKVSVDIAFPKQHLMEIMAAALQMQQQIMQQQMQQQQENSSGSSL